MRLPSKKPNNQLGECDYWKCHAAAYGTSTISGRRLCKPHLNREYMIEQTKKISTTKSRGER